MRKQGHKIACLAFGLVVIANMSAAQETLIDLETIVVTGDRETETPPGTTVISAERLEREYQGATVETILREIPGVTVQGGGGNGAELSVNIRGQQDFGRVAVTVDGMRQNFARSGHDANGTFSIDTEMIREVEVTRGPGEKAGATGGAVEFRRVQADDLIEEGDSIGGEFRLRYGNDTRSPTVHGEVAARLSESVDVLFAMTRAEDDDYTSPEGTEVAAWQLTRSALATLGLNTQNGARLSFSFDRMNEEYYTGGGTGYDRFNELKTGSNSFTYSSDDLFGGWSVDGTVYQNWTKLNQRRLSGDLNQRSFDSTTRGLLVEAEGYLATGNIDHQIRATLEGFRDEVDVNDPNGSLTPTGHRSVWSLSVEDRVDFGWATLSFGMSADSYEMESDNTSNIWANDVAFSPRLGIEIPLGPAFTLTASAELASRYPSLNETLVNGVHPPPGTIPIDPNPYLRPERMQSFEVGLGYVRDSVLSPNDRLSLQATAFHNRFEDYIEIERKGTVLYGYYQYDNVDRARIVGFEFEGSYESDRLFGRLSGQVTDGVNLDNDETLSKVAPDQIVLTAGFYSADGRGQYGARYTSVAAKDEGDIRSEAWETFDLFMTRDLGANTMVSLALNNILNEDYTPHQQLYPSQGFNALASIIVKF